ncbi:RNase adapter RapZ [Caldanaerobius polysaccharolyticus]|jgi:P-loop ATPase protein family.|uniref:RNase adapter RapZ n=1 Tax=Caldanaerobius polysaccharolyticus TaxID=44256 RepID=UPI000479FC38|nr:RNase adapter RapZ [Caldanaerobius polysaccharolyticus]
MRFVIITGLSGAGRSQAVKALEDMGYFCIDNLPPSLIPKLSELFTESKKIDKVALVIDLRGGQFFDDLNSSLEYLQKMNYQYEILFLEASDTALIKRYKESRRKHPLAHDGRVIAAIHDERKRLESIRNKATAIIDTSNLTISQLREQLANIFLEGRKFKGLVITVVSFGYKSGIPLDADLVFDVRFLPNPFYIEELKDLTGNDAPVRDYVLSFPVTKEFMAKLYDILQFLIPYYVKEGKTQLVIAVGCTGGKHRSVTVANELYNYLRKNDYAVFVEHRDILK